VARRDAAASPEGGARLAEQLFDAARAGEGAAVARVLEAGADPNALVRLQLDHNAVRVREACRARPHCRFVPPAHPLQTRIANLFGTSVSETAMRPHRQTSAEAVQLAAGRRWHSTALCVAAHRGHLEVAPGRAVALYHRSSTSHQIR
jgi:hypothetical protein